MNRSLLLSLLALILLVGCGPSLAGDEPAECTDEDGDGFTTCDGDCADLDPLVSPSALEVCNGLDDDCSGVADQTFDGDADGHLETNSCPGVLGADDCDDEDPAVHGTAPEFCDEVDHNCDGDPVAGAVDASEYCPDLDNDGFTSGTSTLNCGGTGWAACSAEEDCDDFDASLSAADNDGDGASTCAGDCDDSDAGLHPAAEELCDGADNNCDGEVDEDAAADAGTWFGDADGDGYGGSQFVVVACVAPTAFVANSDDCDDLDATSYPGGTEVCDGADNNCDASVDEGVLQTFYGDADGDGYGDPSTPVQGCQLPAGASANDLDCDDGVATISPASVELCDGIDNDCDGSIPGDELDGDGDGQSGCSGDCDDSDPARFSGNPELCDGVDNDCDGIANAGGLLGEADADGDGQLACAGDCNDLSAAVFVGAPEQCNGLDDDCDLVLPANEADADGDGQFVCAGDCDDLSAAVFVGAAEQCNGLDDDCNGSADEGFDADGDGVTTCGPDGDPASLADNDCDDSVATGANSFPGNSELCDGQDNDCDLLVPANEVDGDGDSEAPCEGDCDDGDPSRFSSATEIVDGIDNDCDGQGRDGVFLATASVLLAGGSYEYTSFTIAASAIVTVTGGPALELAVFDDADLLGTLDLSGSAGGDAGSAPPTPVPGAAGGGGGGASGGAGGYSNNGVLVLGVAGSGPASGGGGGSGTVGGGGGGGGLANAGTAGGTGVCSPPRCGTTITVAGGAGGSSIGCPASPLLTPGSGGGGGGYGSADNEDGGSGGGGGGMLRIEAGGTVTVSGTIDASGGAGGSSVQGKDGGGGGGGSGGSVWLAAPVIEDSNATIDLSGGGGGSAPVGNSSGDPGDGGSGSVGCLWIIED